MIGPNTNDLLKLIEACGADIKSETLEPDEYDCGYPPTIYHITLKGLKHGDLEKLAVFLIQNS